MWYNSSDCGEIDAGTLLGPFWRRIQLPAIDLFHEAFESNQIEYVHGFVFIVNKKLTANTRGLRAHIRRCSFDKCNEFLQISSWLWCINAFGSNNPTFCNACKPRSLKQRKKKWKITIVFLSRFEDKSTNENKTKIAKKVLQQIIKFTRQICLCWTV